MQVFIGKFLKFTLTQVILQLPQICPTLSAHILQEIVVSYRHQSFCLCRNRIRWNPFRQYIIYHTKSTVQMRGTQTFLNG
jgi:hypothetical protein